MPEPKPGLVIRYDYLWLREAAVRRELGKERPACLAAASDSTTRPRFVVILPITHSQPGDGTIGIEIPRAVRLALGFDDAPNWIIVSEHNVDEWPNGGLASLPGRPGVFAYGFIPPRLFAQVKARFADLVREGRTERVRR